MNLDRTSHFWDPLDDQHPATQINPIHRQAPRPSRLKVLALTAPLAALGLAGLASLDLGGGAGLARTGNLSTRIDLRPWAWEPPPPGPGGGGHPGVGLGSPGGNGHRDPAQAKAAAEPPGAEPTRAALPDLLPATPIEPLRAAVGQVGLPTAPGGNGRSSGIGNDALHGGPAQLAPVGADPAASLEVAFSARAQWDRSWSTFGPVTVRVLIAANGSVVAAQAIAGPKEAWASSEKAARKWLFLVPKQLQGQCPIPAKITFYAKDFSPG